MIEKYDTEDTIGNYEHMAEKYGTGVDTEAIHRYYERPATCSLLPPSLLGKNVLDLGCGSGWYSEYLLKQGANVTALDASKTMVELTQARLNNQGRFIIADIEKNLNFFADGEFDLILAPLVIHYAKDWKSLFSELSRILKQDSLFVFSVHHPCGGYESFKLDNYYDLTLVTDVWENWQVPVKFYHHTLQDLSDNLVGSGFVIERLYEPKPSLEMQLHDPKIYDKIKDKPWFLFGSVRKSCR